MDKCSIYRKVKIGYKCQSTQSKPMYLNNKTLVYLSSIESENGYKTWMSASKADATSRPKSLDNTCDNKNQRIKEKNGTFIIEAAKPTTKTVRPSLRTHQNLEAPTLLKTRILSLIHI